MPSSTALQFRQEFDNDHLVGHGKDYLYSFCEAVSFTELSRSSAMPFRKYRPPLRQKDLLNSVERS